MSCITTILLGVISRIGILVWWIMNPESHDLPFLNGVIPGLAFPGWLWTLVGGVFLPWTTLAYLFFSPGGIVGYEWIALAVGLLLDLASHGGAYSHRRRIPLLGR